MASNGEGILLSDLAICVGIVDSNPREKVVHLVVMEQPQILVTKPWKNGEKFRPGHWYLRMHQKKEGQRENWAVWKRLEDGLVPTVLNKVDRRQTQIEFSLPIFFVPNFSASQFCADLKLADPLNAQRPICPLFGADNNQILPIPSCGFRDKEGNSPSPGVLYCARVQLSFSLNSLPNWSYGSNGLDKFQWSPPFEEEDSIYRHLFNSYRSEGIIVEKIGLQNGQNCYLALEESGKMVIFMNKMDRKVNLGKIQPFFPIRIVHCFQVPLTLALNFAPQKRNASSQPQFPLKIKKLGNFDYSLELEINEGILTQFESNKQNVRLPFLGILLDPFSHIQKAKFKIGQQICITAKVQWHFQGETALWTVFGCKKIGENENGRKIDAKNAQNESSDESIMGNYSKGPNPPSISRQSAQNSTIAWLSGVAESRILAVHFALKPANGNAIFLEFDESGGLFTARHDINLQPGQNALIGEWYWVKYFQPNGSLKAPTARELVKTNSRCKTRRVLGVCAQFTGCRQSLINIWHNSAKFCGCEIALKSEWWPNLCAKCFPKLCGTSQFQSVNSLNNSSTLSPPSAASSHSQQRNNNRHFPRQFSSPICSKPIQKKAIGGGGELALMNSSRTNSFGMAERARQNGENSAERKLAPSIREAISRENIQQPTANRLPPIPINSNIFRKAGGNLDGYGRPPVFKQIQDDEIPKLPPKIENIGNLGEETDSEYSSPSAASISLNVSPCCGNEKNQNSSADEQQIGDEIKIEAAPKQFEPIEFSGNSANQPGGFGGGRRRRNAHFSEENADKRFGENVASQNEAIENENAAQRLRNAILPKNLQISTIITEFCSLKMSDDGSAGEGYSAVPSSGFGGANNFGRLQRNGPPTNPFKMSALGAITDIQKENIISEALNAEFDVDGDF